MRFNSRLGFDPPDAGNVVRLIGPDRTEIPDPGMVVARIKNVGRTSITEHDYVHQLGLTFPGNTRRLVTVDVTEARPPDLQDLLTGRGFEVRDNKIILPKVHLNPGSEFKLVALLEHTSGEGKPEVQTNGILRNGRIFLDSDGRRLRRSTIIGGALTTLLAGALVAVLLINSQGPDIPPGPTCATGTLTVTGSSVFTGVAEQLAQRYMANCPGSTITVDGSTSVEGLAGLKNAPPEERLKLLTLAEGRFDGSPEFQNLEIAATLAIVSYTFVLHPGVPVRELSRTELKKIFLGQTTNWNQVQVEDGVTLPDLPIRVVGRRNTSGSRLVIEKQLLDGEPAPQITSDTCEARRAGLGATGPILCEQDGTSDVVTAVNRYPGAIGYVDLPSAVTAGTSVAQIKVGGHGATLEDIESGYQFWTVEYLYSYGPTTETDPLTRSFATFMTSPEAMGAIGGLRHIPCVQANLQPEQLCDQGT
ncbi:PstS family phosphate ABC transporter substrate-binding protein [Catenuloplanes atrovinosus]|uniref:Phosphate transport system substrate-binding protein n=1 Tax=Catenuloplanes atrovinosus TaxID=137266 RepID=A0AAE3YLT8_9ACTN|nr:substrate-binding domain-containing protein [Catenuloplanes atrovinosus]MDR7275885.1 phosphate transport system substrate-binding protein [Catenuloplanes atrovinosus]